jgi:hypothetical protein
VNNIELLPKPQALLWRYCDDDRAIHPRATFIFSGHGPNLASCESNDITKAVCTEVDGDSSVIIV